MPKNKLYIVWRWLETRKQWIPVGQPMELEQAKKEISDWGDTVCAIYTEAVEPEPPQ